MSKDAELTITVPEAGRRYFGLCRNASYAAAERGEFPRYGSGDYCACRCALWKPSWTGRGIRAMSMTGTVEAARGGHREACRGSARPH